MTSERNESTLYDCRYNNATYAQPCDRCDRSCRRQESTGRWVCPRCGWVHVATPHESPEEQQAKVDGGWWWCAQGHEQTRLVREDSERSLLQENRRRETEHGGLVALLELAYGAMSDDPKHDNLAREIKAALEAVR